MKQVAFVFVFDVDDDVDIGSLQEKVTDVINRSTVVHWSHALGLTVRPWVTCLACEYRGPLTEFVNDGGPAFIRVVPHIPPGAACPSCDADFSHARLDFPFDRAPW